jgi:hypothetical protein
MTFYEGQKVEVKVRTMSVANGGKLHWRKAKIVRPYWTLHEALVEFRGITQREPIPHSRIRSRLTAPPV